MYIYADLETVPTEDADLIAEIAADITHPGNMSKPETIALWEKSVKPDLIAEAVKRTGLDGGLGKICCIGWALEMDDVQWACGPDEREILMRFFASIEEANMRDRYMSIGGPTCWVGHNIHAFDLRFLWQRAVVQRIRPPRSIPFDAKPWGERIFDTMLKWNPEYSKKISLARLSKALGVPSSKGDMDGSKVWEAYKAGEYERIGTYCGGDIAAVRSCHRRMIFLEK